MIKLKELLKEVGGPMNMWRTPPETPDQVITILHHVMAQILKKNKNANEYVVLHTYKGKDGKRWMLSNVKDQNKGLVYKEDEQSWYSTNRHMKAPLNPIVLNAIIKRWVDDE